MSRLLEVVDIEKHYALQRGFLDARPAGVVRAVDGVSLFLNRGETLTLVGESGCGKSTLARLVLRLIEPTSGAIRFDGEDITTVSATRLRALRRRMQIVFQDPFSSLSPRMTVRQIIEEPLLVHGVGDRGSRRAWQNELLSLVGLDESCAERLPHEFSGGQRQRIGIARALALRPDLVVCDEPVSALDVSIRAQVINLLKSLQSRFELSYLFIAHDLAVVRQIADRVAVMYLGRILESGSRDDLFARSRHPYTRSLLAAVPRPDPHRERRRSMTMGDLPSPLAVPPGCRFHTRCPLAIDRCATVEPQMEAAGEGHFTACHRWRELPPLDREGETRRRATAVDRRLALYARGRERSGTATG
jgi:oligopeptide transport system ATP-binding protein